MNLRDSQVLQHKENLEWNWNLIGTILKVWQDTSWSWLDWLHFIIHCNSSQLNVWELINTYMI